MKWGTRLLRLCVFVAFYELLQVFMRICNGLCVDYDIYARIKRFMRTFGNLCVISRIHTSGNQKKGGPSTQRGRLFVYASIIPRFLPSKGQGRRCRGLRRRQ